MPQPSSIPKGTVADNQHHKPRHEGAWWGCPQKSEEPSQEERNTWLLRLPVSSSDPKPQVAKRWKKSAFSAILQ